EHDAQIMFAADRILDMGPGPGERGGEIVFFGAPEKLKSEKSLTGEYLSGRKVAAEPQPPKKPRDFIELIGASEHNLKAIHVRIPLERRVCVTGVSGSGKSTLIQDVLYPALRKAHGKPSEPPGVHRTLRGADRIDEVVLVDQSPIGKMTRSNPASYVGAFDEIRKLFAKTTVARERGYTPGTFSFNSGNGRCPTCSGCGFEHVEMQFLSDVYLRCPDCDGRRYRGEVLEAKIEGKSIADVLGMTVREASRFFRKNDEVQARLAPPGASSPCGSASQCRRSRGAKRSASSSPGTSSRAATKGRSSFSSTSRRRACTSTTWRSWCAHSGSSSPPVIPWS